MHALLIIDMQEAYFKSSGLASRKSVLVSNINRHIDTALINNEPVYVIHTVHSKDKRTWTRNMLEDNQGFAFEGSDETKSVTGLNTDSAQFLVKARDSAFHDTKLLSQLHEDGIDSLTLTGVSTHSCIFHTAAAAYAYGFEVIIPNDGVDDENEALAQQAVEYLRNEYRQTII